MSFMFKSEGRSLKFTFPVCGGDGLLYTDGLYINISLKDKHSWKIIFPRLILITDLMFVSRLLISLSNEARRVEEIQEVQVGEYRGQFVLPHGRISDHHHSDMTAVTV